MVSELVVVECVVLLDSLHVEVLVVGLVELILVVVDALVVDGLEVE